MIRHKMQKGFWTVSMVFLLANCKPKEESSAEDWTPLLNKDLSGWDIKIAGRPLNDNYKNTFRVEDSILRISYDQYEKFENHFGHLYYKTPLSYYRLKFQYRMTGNHLSDAPVWADKNSGIMIHSQSAQSMDIDQDFPVSLEMQLLVKAGGGENPTGNICTPGTQIHMNGILMKDHCINSSAKTYNSGQWISGVVEVFGDSLIRHIIEGDTVLTYTKPQIGGGFVDPNYTWASAHITDSMFWISRAGTPLREGYIALQAESQPVDFRRLELLSLIGCKDRKAKNYRDYYVKSDNSKCVY